MHDIEKKLETNDSKEKREKEIKYKRESSGVYA